MFDRDARKALLISLVGGAILLYVVEPLLRFMPSLVLRVVGAVSDSWINAIFRDAAQPEPTESLPILTILLLLCVVLILILTASRSLDKPNPAPATTTQTKWFASSAFVAWFVVVIFLFGFSLLRDTSSSIERCFHYRLTVLSPYLSDRESKDLAASFTLMRGQPDYEVIRGRLREYAEKYNVTPVLKSLEATRQGQRRCI
jgi:hypothetical protein